VKAAGALLAGSLADQLERLAAVEAERDEALPTFREFLESPDFAGPYMEIVGISPIVGAIVDASEGSPVTLSDEECRAVFGCGPEDLPLGEAPRVVVVNAGRQCGKTSNLGAPKAVHAAWTVPAPKLRPGQVARVAIICPRADQAQAAFNYCRGIVESSPRLRRNVEKVTTEQILLRRPDGHLVEIVTGAADAGGSAARSTTLLFCLLDEVAFFFDDDGDHSVSDKAIFDAASGTIRNLDDAQIWMVSTPWIEGTGLMEELIEKHWGKRGDVLVAARISSYALRGNADDGSLREETDTDETYAREVLAIPMPKGTQGFFSPLELARAVERKPPAGEPQELGAGGDFAIEKDCLASAVVGRYLGGFFAPRMIAERHATPGDERAWSANVRELGGLVAGAGATQILVDTWRRASVREHMHLEGIAVADTPGGDQGQQEHYGALKRVIAEGLFCLGLLPRNEAEYVRDQLRAVVSAPAGPGRFKISSPRTKRTLEGVGAGRIGAHGDVADAVIKAAWQAGAGRLAASWDKPKVAAHTGQQARQAAARTRTGAGGSMDYLRARSAGVGLGRVKPPGDGDD
jgi:hypothetical protein